MADIRGCERFGPHAPHPWVSSAYEKQSNHWCPGVPDDTTSPVDILFTSTEPVLDDEGNPMKPDRERDTRDYTKGFTYGTSTGQWYHDECGSYVFDLETHTKWHESLDRALRDR